MAMTVIPDLPPGTIGFEVSGKLEAEDYRDTLLPVLQKAAADGEIRGCHRDAGVRGLLGWGLLAGHEDGDRHVALVEADRPGHRRRVDEARTEWFGWMTPGEVKHFPLAERAAAIAWTAG